MTALGREMQNAKNEEGKGLIATVERGGGLKNSHT